MVKVFNRWRRFWSLFMLAFLVSTIVLVVLLWPQREPGMLADLHAPECQEWRETPDGVFPDDDPARNEPCRSIRSFLYHKRVTLRSEGDYDEYLVGARVRAVLMPLAIWAGFAAGTYLIGMAGSWGAGRLRKDKKRIST